MSDDTPTQRFDQQPPAAGDTTIAPEAERRRSLVPVLIAVGAVLFIAVVVLLILLLSRVNGGPSALAGNSGAPTDSTGSSATPMPVPTVTVTVAPAQTTGSPPERPNGPNVLLQKYTISPNVVDCSPGAPAGSNHLHISWTTLNGQAIFFGVNTIDAQAGGMGWMDLPLSGTQHNFPAGYDPFVYPCAVASQQYTFTAIGQASKQSLTITVHRK